MKKWIVAMALCLTAAFLLPSCAQNAFYYPDNVDYGSPTQEGLAYQAVEFTSKDGTTLHGWFVPAKGL
ncbi:MAG: alpha/beta hydrolase, partial [Alysiella sp.]|nr:alpha/beta hydrolase [Alysiella sp.]